MPSNAKNNVTPADVAAKATEDKLVTSVPAQADHEQDTTPTGEKSNSTEHDNLDDCEPVLLVIDGGKKTLGERLTAVVEEIKKNKKTFLLVGTAAVAVTYAFMRHAANNVEVDLEIVTEEVAPEDQVTDEQTA